MKGLHLSGKFFHKVVNLSELKEQYRQLANQYHPDHGGSTEKMQALNEEYNNFLQLYRETVSYEDFSDAQEEQRKYSTEQKTGVWKQSEKEKGYKETNWYVTREQLERMSNGERKAVDEFFSDNALHLFRTAARLLRQLGYYYNPNKVNFVEVNDFIHQAYVEIRLGMILFDYSTKSISASIAHCMKWACVGGNPENTIYHYKPKNSPKNKINTTRLRRIS